MVNVTVQMDRKPEVSIVETEGGPMVEVRYTTPDTTIDLLLTPAALSLLMGGLALAHIQVRDQEVSREPSR